MKNYVRCMVKDYGAICKMTGLWFKNYWAGYLAITAAVGALTYVVCERSINNF